MMSRGPGNAQAGNSSYIVERGESPRSCLGTGMDTRAMTVDQPGDGVIRGRAARSLSPP